MEKPSDKNRNVSDRQTLGSPDPESEAFLNLLARRQRATTPKYPNVRTALIVMSAAAMVFDKESLRQKVLVAYPGSQVYFANSRGRLVGKDVPKQVDLLIDLTSPGQRESFFCARGLRKLARIAVGRKVGFFRKRLYESVYDEDAHKAELPKDVVLRERQVQQDVFALAGIAFGQSGDLSADRGASIALELPPMSKI